VSTVAAALAARVSPAGPGTTRAPGQWMDAALAVYFATRDEPLDDLAWQRREPPPARAAARVTLRRARVAGR
jgi:hypothetical protein